MRLLALVIVAACGRVSFDATPDAAIDHGFCATALPQVPADATAVLCMDFETVPLGPLEDQQQLAGEHLYVRGSPGFERLSIDQNDIATTRAFHYAPPDNPACSDGCCYGDVFLDFSASVFVDRAHFEYDHYLIDDRGGWIGSMFWGALNYPYMTNFVTPAFELARWQHVTIDGSVGTAQPLVITVDGITRTNNASTNDLGFGINATIGTFCWDAPGRGYIDNILFWAR